MALSHRDQALILSAKYLTTPEIVSLESCSRTFKTASESLWLEKLDPEAVGIFKLADGEDWSAKEIYKSNPRLRDYWPQFCKIVDTMDLLPDTKEILKFSSFVQNCLARTGQWQTFLKIISSYPSYASGRGICGDFKHLERIKFLCSKEFQQMSLPPEKGGIGLTYDFILNLRLLWEPQFDWDFPQYICQYANPHFQSLYLSPEQGGIRFSLDFILQMRRIILVTPGFHTKGWLPFNNDMCKYEIKLLSLLNQKEIRRLFSSVAKGGIGLRLNFILEMTKIFGCDTLRSVVGYFLPFLSERPIMNLFLPVLEGGMGLTLQEVLKLLQQNNDLCKTEGDLMKLADSLPKNFAARVQSQQVPVENKGCLFFHISHFLKHRFINKTTFTT